MRYGKLILLCCIYIPSVCELCAMDHSNKIKVYRPEKSCTIRVFNNNPECLGIIQINSSEETNNYYVYSNGEIIGRPLSATKNIIQLFLEKGFFNYFEIPSNYTVQEVTKPQDTDDKPFCSSNDLTTLHEKVLQKEEKK